MRWRIINQNVSGEKRLVIQKREDSERFCFVVERYFGAAEEDEGAAWWEPAWRNAQISN